MYSLIMMNLPMKRGYVNEKNSDIMEINFYHEPHEPHEKKKKRGRKKIFFIGYLSISQ